MGLFRTVLALLALTTLGACTASPSFVLREEGGAPEESTSETTPLAPTPPAQPGADPTPAGESGSGGAGESNGGGGAPKPDAGAVDAGGGGNNGNDAGKGKGKDKDKD